MRQIMKFTTCIFVLILSGMGVASANPLTVERDVNTHQVKKINYPEGFSVEYFYDAQGGVSKKKFSGFSEYTKCSKESPCLYTLLHPEFSSGVLNETFQKKYKNIPSLLVLSQRLNQSKAEKILKDLQSIWNVITLNYLNVTTTDPKLIEGKYRILNEGINDKLSSSKNFNEQVQFLLNELFPRITVLEKSELGQLVPSLPLNQSEKILFTTNIKKIAMCNPMIGKTVHNFLNSGNIVRQRSVTENQLKVLQDAVDHKYLKIVQENDTSKKINLDPTWLKTRKDVPSIQDALKKILFLQPTLMHVPFVLYENQTPKITITDRMMMYYPNRIEDVMFDVRSKTDRQFYLGDANVNIDSVFGKNYPNFEWMLLHEYAHTVQETDWTVKIESEKMYSMARVAIKGDAKLNLISKELKDKLQKELIEPMNQALEQSASLFALDSLSCF